MPPYRKRQHMCWSCPHNTRGSHYLLKIFFRRQANTSTFGENNSSRGTARLLRCCCNSGLPPLFFFPMLFRLAHLLLSNARPMIVCVVFTSNRSAQPGSPCRSFNPIDRRDTRSVVTKLRHSRDATFCYVRSKAQQWAMQSHPVILDTTGTTYTYYEM